MKITAVVRACHIACPSPCRFKRRQSLVPGVAVFFYDALLTQVIKLTFGDPSPRMHENAGAGIDYAGDDRCVAHSAEMLSEFLRSVLRTVR